MAAWFWANRHKRAVIATALVSVVIALALLTPLACGPRERELPIELRPVEHKLLDRPPMVRVLLADRLEGRDIPSLSASGTVSLEGPGGKVLPVGAALSLKNATIGASRDGIIVGNRSYSEPAVFVRTGKDGTFSLGQKGYRGDLELRRRADGSLMLINHVDLEDYLRGVVASEMPNNWPDEALRAQAIASRGYAYALLSENNGAGLFDLSADFRTAQVYEGIAGETSASDRAVDSTRGLVPAYNGKPFRAYFSSACAGHTEACGLVWDDYPTIAPLSGVICPWCRQSKWYEPWEVSFTESEIKTALSRGSNKMTSINDIVLVDLNRDGHADRVELSGSPSRVSMKGNDFRLAVGSGKLKSLMCSVRKSGDKFIFSGRGFGHGVGMCQFGALGMANAGKRAEEVINHYYPGCEIWRIYR